jgi:hypothetical protein
VTTAHHVASYLSSVPGQTATADQLTWHIEEESDMDLPTNHPEGSGQYAIRVKGHLAARWEQSFDGFTLTPESDGTTVLEGFIVDQAALHGVLRRLGDLGLPLLSVTPTTDQSN